VHPVSRLLGLAGGGEDGARVGQSFEPGRDVGRMLGPRPMGDAEIGKD
jgi:hypothetical protein